MNNEIANAFRMAYLPVAQKRNRLNGEDFIGVAVPIMDYVRKQTSSPADIKKAARTMVLTFNDWLNPKLTIDQIEDWIDLLVENGPLTRQIAKENADEFLELLKR